jgi:hypothetical protein
MIPYAHAQTLAAAGSNTEMITLPCGHNDCPRDWEEHWKNIGKFLNMNSLLP